jgi:hypothetical protein
VQGFVALGERDAHNDREDFKKRMDEALVEPKDAKPTEPATPVTK